MVAVVACSMEAARLQEAVWMEPHWLLAVVVEHSRALTLDCCLTLDPELAADSRPYMSRTYFNGLGRARVIGLTKYRGYHQPIRHNTEMKTLFVLFLGAAIGFGIYWYLQHPDADRQIHAAGEKISSGVEQTRDKISESVSNIDTQEIKDELARTGFVVRKKAAAAGARIADAAADARITAAIKSKFALDRDLSALSISVNTTRGKVTLSGTVSSHDLIKRAMRIALEPEGATEVVSTLQVKN